MDYKWKLLCVDLDWTLCKWEFWWWKEPEPILSRIDYINNIYINWAHIIIYTARNPKYFIDTFSRLIKYGVMFHWIAMQMKPWADLYIDDKAIHADLFFSKSQWI